MLRYYQHDSPKSGLSFWELLNMMWLRKHQEIWKIKLTLKVFFSSSNSYACNHQWSCTPFSCCTKSLHVPQSPAGEYHLTALIASKCRALLVVGQKLSPFLTNIWRFGYVTNIFTLDVTGFSTWILQSN